MAAGASDFLVCRKARVVEQALPEAGKRQLVFNLLWQGLDRLSGAGVSYPGKQAGHEQNDRRIANGGFFEFR